MKFPVYLDNQATTPVDPRVLESMMPYLQDKFGNVGSAHLCGRDVVGPVAIARKQVADLIGAKPREIVFTSGATESDNLAIKGIALAHSHKGRHIVTQVTEHKAVLDSCAYLETQGFEVTYLGVDKDGLVSVSELKEAIRSGKEGTTDKTVLVSIMGANNEIGTLQPWAEIGSVTKSHGIFFHVDAAQTAGKVPFSVEDAKADLVSLSAHKMYGPKGIGALYVRSGVELECQMHGGGQENGVRAGTLAVPMVVALGEACRLALFDLQSEVLQLGNLRKRLEDGILGALDGVLVNGHKTQKVPGNLNLTFDGIDGDRLMLGLGQLCCSATSACSSTSARASHVLKAIGRSEAQANASVRFGIGRFNDQDEIDFAIAKVVETVTSLKG